MEQHNSKGWLNRRKLSEINRYENADEERLAIRRERQKLYDEQAANAEAAKAAQDAALVESTCRCVACGGTGRTTITKAAGIIEAMHNFGFQGYKPSRQTVIALDAIAKGNPNPPGAAVVTFSYGSISPAPGHVSPSVEITPVAVETPKAPTKGKKTVFLSDGALIED
ncbi:hypothetical protein [Methylobacterium sp. Leaf100]|uniref:hypothetical protein n=1 Tax=Methylobacterium sp. Leaf100 TaxID=1736252 RepID=UPI0007001367|nr:hypothetical protein [Methylobacterium sp. Leaf100]KQP26646.1 hypothetical protein ASF25_07860 [Methylobacterium sp. Leaf100]